MKIFYNEFDSYAAQWLENLVNAGLLPSGVVDRRDIQTLTGDDCAESSHFFAGIGGWSYALKLAGWRDDDPVWTGSCPCQPFSCAGKQAGESDERHLWPTFHRLIYECRPPVVFGEQVASSAGREWLAGVRNDLEGVGYVVGAADLCAASVQTPHIRQRLFWVAVADDHERLRSREEQVGEIGSGRDDTQREDRGRTAEPAREGTGTARGVGNTDDADVRTRSRQWSVERSVFLRDDRRKDASNGLGTDDTSCLIVKCSDDTFRRVSAQPGDEPLAHGIPTGNDEERLGQLLARLGELGVDPDCARYLVKGARANKNGRLRGYGNAIVPQVAAVFIRSVMEMLELGGAEAIREATARYAKIELKKPPVYVDTTPLPKVKVLRVGAK